MTTPTQVDEVDGADEDDHDFAETALGAALAALLVAELLPGPASFLTGIAGWNARVEAAIGPTLTGFLQRSAFDLAQETGVDGASALAFQSAEQVYPKILSWVQDRSHETLQNLTDAHVDDDNTAHAATVAAENLARGAAVYAKSEVREHTVGKLGAVWKIWKTKHDDRVRSTHRELDGEMAPYGGSFIVDEIPIRYPGDPDAPIELTAGCRCRLKYRIKPKDMDFADV